MPKSKGTSVAAAVRDIIDKLGGVDAAKPKPIVAELQKLGIKNVDEKYVSIIKSNYKRKQGEESGARGRAGKRGRIAAETGTDRLKAASALVKAAGGFSAARQALDVLESLQVPPR